jgi:hypothetical protein
MDSTPKEIPTKTPMAYKLEAEMTKLVGSEAQWVENLPTLPYLSSEWVSATLGGFTQAALSLYAQKYD